jgi:hypothetical protein
LKTTICKRAPFPGVLFIEYLTLEVLAAKFPVETGIALSFRHLQTAACVGLGSQIGADAIEPGTAFPLDLPTSTEPFLGIVEKFGLNAKDTRSGPAKYVDVGRRTLTCLSKQLGITMLGMKVPLRGRRKGGG